LSAVRIRLSAPFISINSASLMWWPNEYVLAQ
jgi:hypothetical protein